MGKGRVYKIAGVLCGHCSQPAQLLCVYPGYTVTVHAGGKRCSNAALGSREAA